ncbi:MAG TPA: hypothetical protein VFV54_04605, partial [Thermoanaerobaculia bacterium]|nr:hypothetical protein [Thermoanaerobaculia bacterium]
MIHPLADEILEQLWYNKEENRSAQTARDLGVHGDPDDVRSAVAALAASGLLRAEPTIELLPPGAERARGIVRR